MESQTRQWVSFYVSVLGEIRGLGVADSEVASAIINQIGKDARMKIFMDERRNSANGSSNGGADLPATDKQKGYLDNLGVKVPAGLTKQRASELIDEALSSTA